MSKEKLPDKAGIYAITNKIDGKIYVGSTRDIYHRKFEHLISLRRGMHENNYLQNAYNKYGEETFVFSVLEIIDQHENLTEREQFYMNKTQCYNREKGYNICKLARSSRGVQRSLETRAKIGAAGKGRKATLEARKNMSRAQKGRIISEEWRRKIGNAQKGEKNHRYGKHWSKEERQKRSILKKIKTRQEIVNGPQLLLFDLL